MTMAIVLKCIIFSSLMLVLVESAPSGSTNRSCSGPSCEIIDWTVWNRWCGSIKYTGEYKSYKTWDEARPVCEADKSCKGVLDYSAYSPCRAGNFPWNPSKCYKLVDGAVTEWDSTQSKGCTFVKPPKWHETTTPEPTTAKPTPTPPPPPVNCALWLSPTQLNPTGSVFCSMSGRPLMELGEQCMKMKTETTLMGVTTAQIVQSCDGTQVTATLSRSVCAEENAVANKCCKIKTHQSNAPISRIICGGEVGFLSAPTESDFDNCDTFCGEPHETTTQPPTEAPTSTTTSSSSTSAAASSTTTVSGCKEWCPGNSHSWKKKCTWKSCKSCIKCMDGCQSWCPQNSSPWSTKCAWKSCKYCNNCANESGCKTWCAGNSHDWDTKCKWRSCKECGNCDASASTPESPECKRWCAGNSHDWIAKCTWKSCRKCSDCDKNRRLQSNKTDSASENTAILV